MNPGDEVQVQLPNNALHGRRGVFDHWTGRLAMVTLGPLGTFAFNPFDLVPTNGAEGVTA